MEQWRRQPFRPAALSSIGNVCFDGLEWRLSFFFHFFFHVIIVHVTCLPDLNPLMKNYCLEMSFNCFPFFFSSASHLKVIFERFLRSTLEFISLVHAFHPLPSPPPALPEPVSNVPMRKKNGSDRKGKAVLSSAKPQRCTGNAGRDSRRLRPSREEVPSTNFPFLENINYLFELIRGLRQMLCIEFP